MTRITRLKKAGWRVQRLLVTEAEDYKNERLEWQALIAGDPTRVKCLVSKDFFLRLLSDADRAELAALESTTGGISFKKKGA